jgi:hypothetical protein
MDFDKLKNICDRAEWLHEQLSIAKDMKLVQQLVVYTDDEGTFKEFIDPVFVDTEMLKNQLVGQIEINLKNLEDELRRLVTPTTKPEFIS